MTRKRWRVVRTAKPGVLKVQYGKAEPWDGPDVVYNRGPGVPSCDGHLLHSYFGCERLVYSALSPTRYLTEKSLLKELEERGYDITTIKFSIEKKK